MTAPTQARAPTRPQGLRRHSWLAVMTAGAIGLAACSSAPPPRFHTLMPSAPTAPPAAASTTKSLAWHLAPVVVPAQVDQPQLVLRRADDTLVMLEQDRWIAPLQDELRAALVEHLSSQIGPPGTRPAPGTHAWRLVVEVRRLDSTPGKTLLNAQWTLFNVGSPTPELRCTSQFEHRTGLDVPALAQGHRQAVQQLAQAMAPALASAHRGQALNCP
jgi:uncharacterized protein